MKPIFKHYLSFFFLLFVFCLPAQKVNRDSLFTVLKNSKADTNRVITLNALFISDRKLKPDSALRLCLEILNLSKKLNYGIGAAMAYNCFGSCYGSMEKKDSSILSYKRSVTYSLKANAKDLAVQSYRKISAICNSIADYPKSIEYSLLALKLAEELNDKQSISSVYNALGNTYYRIRDFPRAIENHKRSLNLRLELGKELYISHSYLNLGNVYNDLRLFDSAFYFYNKALGIQRKQGNKVGEAYTVGNIGIILFRQEKYDESLKNLLYQVKLLEGKDGEEYIVSECFVQIGAVYNGLKKYDEAIQYLTKAIAMCKKNDFKGPLSHAYVTLSETYEKQGKPIEALKYYKEHKTLSDSINNNENATTIANLQFRYQSDKEEKIRRLEEERQVADHQAEVAQHKIIIWAAVLGLMLVAVFSFFLFKRNRLTQKQNVIIEEQKKIVEEKQKDILDSIHYAKRIQSSLITSEKYIEKNLDRLGNESHS